MKKFRDCASMQVSRGLLPDTGSEYEGEGGNINDALEFLLLNFTEMNKLWVRMQHQGSGKDRCVCDGGCICADSALSGACKACMCMHRHLRWLRCHVCAVGGSHTS